ncbi:MAG: hypothetical protein V8Q76_04325 [Bacteroides intestinalis]
MMTGASITKVDESNGTYTLTLSDGQKIVIKPGGGNISIVVTDTEAIITIEGEEYILPLGSLVNSLIYSPETIDGIVEIGNTATTVNFWQDRLSKAWMVPNLQLLNLMCLLVQLMVNSLK